MKGFVLLVVAGVSAVIGVSIGVLPVQVEDQGQAVTCAPAVFTAGNRLPDLACADVVGSLQTLAVMLIVAAGILIVAGGMALRRRPEEVPSGALAG